MCVVIGLEGKRRYLLYYLHILIMFLHLNALILPSVSLFPDPCVLIILKNAFQRPYCETDFKKRSKINSYYAGVSECLV